jgi:hypothetical protein
MTSELRAPSPPGSGAWSGPARAIDISRVGSGQLLRAGARVLLLQRVRRAWIEALVWFDFTSRGASWVGWQTPQAAKTVPY